MTTSNNKNQGEPVNYCANKKKVLIVLVKMENENIVEQEMSKVHYPLRQRGL